MALGQPTAIEIGSRGRFGENDATVTSIAVPTLAVADNADGTGATATIAAGEAAATNVVKTRLLGTATWVTSGTRTGNGTVALALGLGVYAAYVQSSSGGVTVYSTPVLFTTTTNVGSVMIRLLGAVRTVIRSLSLAGIDSANVDYRKLPWERGLAKPGVWICPGKEGARPANNESEDLDYPIDVVVVRASNQSLTDEMAAFTLWRQRVRLALTPAPGYRPILDSVAEAYSVRVEPGPVYDPGSFAAQHDVGALRVWVTCRESGGVT